MSEVKNPIPEGAEEFRAPIIGRVGLEIKPNKIEEKWGIKDSKLDDETLRYAISSSGPTEMVDLLNRFDFKDFQNDISQETVDIFMDKLTRYSTQMAKIMLEELDREEANKPKSTNGNITPYSLDSFFKPMRMKVRPETEKNYLFDKQGGSFIAWRMENIDLSHYLRKSYPMDGHPNIQDKILKSLNDQLSNEDQSDNARNFMSTGNLVGICAGVSNPNFYRFMTHNLSQLRTQLYGEEYSNYLELQATIGESLMYRYHIYPEDMRLYAESILGDKGNNTTEQIRFLDTLESMISSGSFSSENNNFDQFEALEVLKTARLIYDETTSSLVKVRSRALLGSMKHSYIHWSGRDNIANEIWPDSLESNLEKRFLDEAIHSEMSARLIAYIDDEMPAQYPYPPHEPVISLLSPDIVAICEEGSDRPIVVLSKKDFDRGLFNLKPFTELNIKASNRDKASNDIYQEFQSLSTLATREDVYINFGINLAELDIRVQNYFLNYLRDNTEDQVVQMAEYSKEFGQDFFTSFLSLEQDPNMANVIFDIAKKHDHKTANEIFNKYADLIGAVDNIRNSLQENFGDKFDNNLELEDKIVDNLLRRGKNILTLAANLTNPDHVQAYLNKLEQVKKDNALLIDTFSALRGSENELSLEDFKSVGLETVTGEKLTGDQKRQLSNIQQTNWVSQGEDGKEVIRRFDELMANPDRLSQNNFYIVENNNQVLGFFRIENGEESEVASFATIQGGAHLKIGNLLIEKAFFEAIKGRKVFASADPLSPVSEKYSRELEGSIVGFTKYSQENDTLKFEFDSTNEASRARQDQTFRGKDFNYLLEQEDAYRGNPEASVRVYIFPQEYEAFVVEAKGAFNYEMPYIITAYATEKRPQSDGSRRVAVAFELRDKEMLNKTPVAQEASL